MKQESVIRQAVLLDRLTCVLVETRVVSQRQSQSVFFWGINNEVMATTVVRDTTLKKEDKNALGEGGGLSEEDNNNTAEEDNKIF